MGKWGILYSGLLLSTAGACVANQNPDPLIVASHVAEQVRPDTPLNAEPVFRTDRTPIAIIIDDLGYHYQRSMAAINLPGAVTLSVIPHSPHGVEVAQRAHQLGKELMLHAPMSNVQDKPLDPGALTENMDHELFLRTLTEDLAAIPYIRGLNNHMGSLLTQETQPMQWLMGELKARQLFFVDSRTSPDSIAWEIAKADDIPTLKRDFFLDHDPDPVKISHQFAGLLRLAKQRGYALAIAHPYPETLHFLQSALPTLENSEFHLLFVSDLLSQLEAQVNTQQVRVGPP